MAEVFKRVNGRKITKVIADNEGVQSGMDVVSRKVGVRAQVILNQSRVDYHADIEVDAGDVDRYVTLSDVRGQLAAMSIEYGRRPGKGHPGAEGRFVLHQAVGLTARGR